MTNNIVNLENLAGGGKVRNLSGKERGEAARKSLSLDSIDRSDGIVEIVVPDYIDTISPSYFQGLFSESIRVLNGEEGFLKKYHFQASQQIMQWVELGIRNSTSSRKPLV